VFSSLSGQLTAEQIGKISRLFKQKASGVRATMKRRRAAEEAAKPRQLSAAAQAMLAPKKKQNKKTTKKTTAASYSVYDDGQEMNWDARDEQGEGYVEATTFKSARSYRKGEW
jgi:hypothetical protein